MEKLKTRMTKGLFAAAIALLLICVIFTGLASVGTTAEKDGEIAVTLTSGESTLDIVKNGATDYTIIYAAAGTLTEDSNVATALRTLFYTMGATNTQLKADISAKLGTHEILIGDTDRAYSATITSRAKAIANEGDHTWIIAEKDGKVYYTANCNEALARGKSDLLAFGTDNSFSIPTGYYKEYIFTKAQIEEEYAQNVMLRIEALKEEIASFVNTDFTQGTVMDLEFTKMKNSPYASPMYYPTEGEHPRLNMNKEVLEAIRYYIENTDEGKALFKTIKAYADEDFDGVLPKASYQTGREGLHNVNERGLAIIEARAFIYLVTGDLEYGYRAVLTMKNYLKTFELVYIVADMCREFGRTVFVTSEIYDWCYYLLTEEDKEQFIVAMTYIVSGNAKERYGGIGAGLCWTGGDDYMEVGYPPNKQDSINGHGAEAQILRDYLSAAIAIFDENPTWYEYVGGRIYAEYIPFRNYYFESSKMYPQGAYNYAYHRHDSDVWNAWMLICATGENPYVPELQQVIHSLLAFETPGDFYFGTGDGYPQTGINSAMANISAVISAIYGDTALREVVVTYYKEGFTSLKVRSTEFSLVHLAIYSAEYLRKTGSLEYTPIFGEVDPVVYNAYPLGEMITRREWNNPEVPAAYMKIGMKTLGGHEHADAGTFQLFYKGLYSGESGKYDRFGSTHFTYYYQATVAHNGLLIFDPTLADYELDGESMDSSSNLARAFYSGSQRGRGNFQTGTTLWSWLESNSTNTGTVTGYEYGLLPDGRADYAYLAGDITAAYSITQASYVGRSMFTLYTDNPEYPMFFIVYDAIDNADENSINKFLLHTPVEPEIDEDNSTVTLTKDEAKLILHSLKGTENIEVIGGGEGKTYLINGIQCEIVVEKYISIDDSWGRVELCSGSGVGSELLNVLYYTDATNESTLSPTLIENEKVIGTKVDNTYVLFSKSHNLNTAEIKLNTEGGGLSRYMLLGMHSGTWHVSVDGVTVAHAYASEEGTMISFYAPSGEVTVTPGDDIAPADGGRIIYNTQGGILPEGTPMTYRIGDEITLPTEVKNGYHEFLGWYTSPDFSEDTRVTELYPFETGDIVLYAKYKHFFISANFEEADFDHTASAFSNSSIQFLIANKTGTNVKTVTENGNTYVRISTQSRDATLRVESGQDTIIQVIKSGGLLTYEIDLAAREDGTPLQTQFMLRSQSGGTDTSVIFFTTNSLGQIYLAGNTSSILIGNLTTHLEKYVFTIDLNTNTVRAYDKNGFLLGENKLKVPDAVSERYEDFSAWFSTVTMLFNFQMYYNGGLCFDNFRIYTGEYECEPAPAGAQRLVFNPGLGKLSGEIPSYYEAGEALTLPTPTSLRSPYVFGGWYTDSKFEGEPIYELLMTEATEPVVLYAKYVYPENVNDIYFNLGTGSVSVNLPAYYTAGVKIVLPTPVSSIPEETFIGWYDNPDFTGEAFTEYTPENADAPITLYARFMYGDGTKNRIEYHTGAGTLPDNAPKDFSAGDAIYLPKLADTETARFIGWYTTPDFKPGTEAQGFVAESAMRPVVVYAKFIVNETLAGSDFESEEVSIKKPSANLPVEKYKASDTVAYNLQSKYAEAVSKKDESGNTYIVLVTDALNPTGTTSSCDPQITVMGSDHKTLVLANGGKVTYEVDLAAVREGNVGRSVFRLRAGTTSDLLFLFSTNPDGSVLFRDSADMPVCTLKVGEFTKIIVTVDIIDATATLFNEYGDAIYTAELYIPEAAAEPKPATFAEWFARMDNPFQWYFSADTQIAFDNLKVYTGEYRVPTELIPEGADRLVLEVGDGEIAGGVPQYYLNGSDYILPVPTPIGENMLFGGWYASPDFTGEAITYIPKGTVGKVELYARYYLEPTMGRIEYVAGDATLPSDAPYFYTAGVTLTLPVPTPNGNYDVFDGWYDNPEFTGEPITSLTVSEAGLVKKLYAKYRLPDGINKIVYNVGDGTLADGAPLYYEAGTAITIPNAIAPTSSPKVIFLGWYDNPEFTGKPVTEINEATADAPITLYALYKTVLLDADFSGSEVNVAPAEDGTAGGIDITFDNVYYQFNKKYAEAHTVKDAAGNTYLTVTTWEFNGTGGTGSCDPIISNNNNYHKTVVRKNGGTVTYEVAMAVPSGENPAVTTFRMRGKNGLPDLIPIFKTDVNGNVLFNGNKNIVIGTLSSDFTRYIFTVDLISEMLYAYNTYGELLASTALIMPSGADPSMTSFMDWYEGMGNPFQWYFERNGTISIDNLTVYTGECRDFDKILENEGKVIFVSGVGALNASLPNKYTVGTAFTLPTPAENEETLEFLGWYDNPEFTGEPIESFTESDAGLTKIFYAKYGLPSYMNTVSFELGNGTAENLPLFYYENEELLLPTPTPNDSEYTFAGWYLSADFTGEKIESILRESASEPIVLYAKYVYGDGTRNKIVYNLGAAVLPEGAPKDYAANEEIILPTPTVPAGEIFLGWYENPDFKGERVEKIKRDNVNEIVELYARITVKSTVAISNFESSALIGVTQSEDVGDSGIYYNIGSKEATVTAVRDEKNNVYMKITSGGGTNSGKGDPTLASTTRITADSIVAGGGLITYEVDLACLSDDDGNLIPTKSTDMRIREDGSRAMLIIFNTSDKSVYLGADKTVKLGELSANFSKFAVTLDIIEGTLTAYDADGKAIATVAATVNLSISNTGATTIVEWLNAVRPQSFQWYFANETKIAIDNVNVYIGAAAK